MNNVCMIRDLKCKSPLNNLCMYSLGSLARGVALLAHGLGTGVHDGDEVDALPPALGQLTGREGAVALDADVAVDLVPLDGLAALVGELYVGQVVRLGVGHLETELFLFCSKKMNSPWFMGVVFLAHNKSQFHTIKFKDT